MTNMFSDVQSLRTSLEALSQEQVEALKHVATTRSLGSVVWITLSLSVISILVLVGLGLFGFIAVEAGKPFWISSYPSNFEFIQICLNALMVGVCLWINLENNLDHLLILVFALLLCACWNLLVAVYGGVDLVKFILGFFGLLQLRYAFQVYRIKQNVSDLQPSSLYPEPQLKQQYDAIWKAIVSSNVNTGNECARLELIPNQRWWQSFLHGNKSVVGFLLFLSDRAIFAYKGRKLLRFIPKTEVLIEIGEGYVLSFPEPSSGVANTKAKGLKQLSKVRMFARLNEEVRSGYIDPSGFESYMNWKKFSDVEAIKQAINTETFSNERQIHNKIKKGKSTAVLLYIFIAVILIIYVMQHLPNS